MIGRSKPGKGVVKPADTALEPVSDKAGDAPDTSATPGSNPVTNVILADLVLRGGGELLRRVVETNLLGRTVDKSQGKGKAQKIIKGGSMGQTLLRTAAIRIATRSVPGAIIVGGGLLAKALYDRKKARKDEQGGG